MTVIYIGIQGYNYMPEVTLALILTITVTGLSSSNELT